MKRLASLAVGASLAAATMITPAFAAYGNPYGNYSNHGYSNPYYTNYSYGNGHYNNGYDNHMLNNRFCQCHRNMHSNYYNRHHCPHSYNLGNYYY